jgi:hypothetical protein
LNKKKRDSSTWSLFTRQATEAVTLMAEDFRGFPQPLQANADKILENVMITSF